MYLRQWTRMPFFDAFGLYRQLRLINHLDYNPVMWLTRPPNPNTGYPLREDLEEPETNRIIKKLLNRYPDLKYMPIVREKSGSSLANEHVVFNFIKQYQMLRDKGLNEVYAFDQAEALFQASIQRKIDQTNISNNLGINNQARSFMSYFNQELEYDQRLKTQRLMRDQQIKSLNENNPFDEHTKKLMEKYKKVLYKVVDKSIDETEQNQKGKTNEIDITQFQNRAKNVFDCYYQRAAINDKLSGLSDHQIIKRIRESPTQIKSRFKKLVNKLEKFGVTLNENMELIIPDSVPEMLKTKFKQPQYAMALMYKDLGFEFSHHKHLDTLQSQLTQLRNEKKSLPNDSNEVNEDIKLQGDENIKKILDEADIRTNQTYKLFETQAERRLRLQIKWTYHKIDELELQLYQSEQNKDHEQLITEKINKHQERITTLVDKLRNLKFQLENKSLESAGKLMFQEHSVLMDSKNEFHKAAQLNLDKVSQYFKMPYEQRRLTQTAQINDDIIHNLIRLKNFKADTKDIGQPTKFTEKSLIDKDAILLEQKLIEQYKIQSMSKRTNLVSDTVEQNYQTTAEDFEKEEGDLELPDDLKSLIQKVASNQVEEAKLKEQEKKREEAAQIALKGQKGSKKKKPKK